jgi:hypothetical protein
MWRPTRWEIFGGVVLVVYFWVLLLIAGLDSSCLTPSVGAHQWCLILAVVLNPWLMAIVWLWNEQPLLTWNLAENYTLTLIIFSAVQFVVGMLIVRLVRLISGK